MGKYQAECDYQLALFNSNKAIESLQAKLAMLREIARDAEMWYSRDTMLGKELRMQAHNALNATQADVDKFMAKQNAEWEKGVLEEVEQFAYMSEGASDVWRKVCVMIKERGEV